MRRQQASSITWLTFSLLFAALLGLAACQPTAAQQMTVSGWFVAIGLDGFLAEDRAARYWLINDEGWYRLALNTWQIDRLGGVQVLNGKWVRVQAEVLARYALRVRRISLEDPPQPPSPASLSGWFVGTGGLIYGDTAREYWLVEDQGWWYYLLLKEEIADIPGGLQVLNGNHVRAQADALPQGALWVHSVVPENPLQPPRQVSLTGELRVIHGDDFDRGIAKVEYWLQDDQGQAYRLLLDEKLTKPFGGPEALANKRVRILADIWPTPPQAGTTLLWVRAIEFEGLAH